MTSYVTVGHYLKGETDMGMVPLTVLLTCILFLRLGESLFLSQYLVWLLGLLIF